jgi:type II secretory pathway pseudopilin PulG
MHTPMQSRRRGFSLTETIVTVALVMILAAAFLPNLLASDHRARVQEAALVLEELSDAITTARYDNQDWPGNLSHLSRPITTADQNICGSNYNSGRVNNWDGPYHDRVFPASGLPIGIGTVRDPMTRVVISGNPSGNGAISHVQIFVDSVPEEDALELNRMVDADGSATEGTVQWAGLSGSGLTTVWWTRTVKGC